MVLEVVVVVLEVVVVVLEVVVVVLEVVVVVLEVVVVVFLSFVNLADIKRCAAVMRPLGPAYPTSAF